MRWETIEFAGQADHTDVVAASGTVTFAPGQTEASVTVEVRGDRLDEPDEYAVLRFFEPTGARLGGLFGLGLVEILDDDPPPTAIAPVGVAREGDGPGRSLRIPVVLSAPSGRPVEITWRTEDGTARAPGDYTSAVGHARARARPDPRVAGDPAHRRHPSGTARVVPPAAHGQRRPPGHHQRPRHRPRRRLMAPVPTRCPAATPTIGRRATPALRSRRARGGVHPR